ncbi:MAG: 23S rRNA (guanosine(2251)-2'-O)-methyltransferase RlmB [Bifidobacteriaceae bacterium]|jgi:23S rRNA (guanosine2251-2'-O)-methyltransferase|nr:23S rRNA (guanosine(2251)-2'-O)-methyltransferase RlmB [Bifidobacteriaceae bacterium]
MASKFGKYKKHNNSKTTIKYNNIIKGPNAILEALKENISLSKIILGENANSKAIQTIAKIAAKKNIKVEKLSSSQIYQIGVRNSQNALAFVNDYKYSTLENLEKTLQTENYSKIVLALDSISDPQNLGAIIRSAAAFGIKYIIITKHKSAQITSGVWKASAGQVARVKIIRVSSLANTIKRLKTLNFYTLSLDGKANNKISDSNLKKQLKDERLLVIFGSEGQGISRLVLEKSDFIAKIPINEKVESLNVSVSAGITLFELLKPSP